MAVTFTEKLREGYRQLVCSLPAEERMQVVCVRDSLAGYRSSEERAVRLSDLVLAYRSGPRSRWGPVLLDVLAPALLASRKRLRRERPFLGQDDIDQQLVAELLAAAGQMPLPRNCCFLQRRLVARANQGVVRVLARERRRQARQESLDFIQDRDEAMSDWERWKSVLPRPGTQ